MTATTHLAELERSVAADEVLSSPVHAATVELACSLAAELNRQTAAGSVQTRTVATYAGLLSSLRRLVAAEVELRRKSRGPGREVSRLAQMQEHAARVTGGAP